ncbi:AEC family transporter [Halanaerobaculum tunisiense]
MILINFLTVFNQILVLFSLLMIGVIVKRLELVDNSLKQNLTNLIIYVTLPALLIDSMNYEFSLERLIQLGNVFIISLVVYALMIGLSYLTIKFLVAEGSAQDIYQFILIFSNVGFMGYPVIKVIYGTSEVVFLAAIYNLIFNILIWSLGVMIISRSQEDNPGFSYDNLINPGIISIGIGFILFLLSIKLPHFIEQTLEILGETTTPLSMIVVGSILAQVKLREIFSNFRLWLVAIIRLVGFPILTLLLLRNFSLDPLVLGVVVILTAMPAAANTAIFAQEFGGDEALASEGVFLTTLLSVVTIPLIVHLLFVI